MGVNASIEGSNPSFSASYFPAVRIPRRRDARPRPADVERGCRLPPQNPALRTRLRHPEAGFAFLGPFSLRLAPVALEPVNVWDYERLAEEALDANAWAYYAGGSGDEVTLRDNVAAFQRWRLRPRVLVDVRTVATATTVLGTDVALPVLIAPLAWQRMAHPEGEAATARAAAAAGTVMCLSTSSTTAPAAVAEAAPGGARWFQVYVFNHGGRQLDGVPASLDVLEEVVEAVGGQVEVLLDGGVRRGTDVLKALALGARAVLIGRAMLYGLAAAGERGVAHVLELLRAELELG